MIKKYIVIKDGEIFGIFRLKIEAEKAIIDFRSENFDSYKCNFEIKYERGK